VGVGGFVGAGVTGGGVAVGAGAALGGGAVGGGALGGGALGGGALDAEVGVGAGVAPGGGVAVGAGAALGGTDGIGVAVACEPCDPCAPPFVCTTGSELVEPPPPPLQPVSAQNSSVAVASVRCVRGRFIGRFLRWKGGFQRNRP